MSGRPCRTVLPATLVTAVAALLVEWLNHSSNVNQCGENLASRSSVDFHWFFVWPCMKRPAALKRPASKQRVPTAKRPASKRPGHCAVHWPNLVQSVVMTFVLRCMCVCCH